MIPHKLVSGNRNHEKQFDKILGEHKFLNIKQFGVSELAKNLGISRSNLHRKVKKEAKCSVSRFICRMRLQKAIEMLRNTSLPVSEVAFDCGFHSEAYFSKCFHDYFGFSPGKAKSPVATESGINKKPPIAD